MLFNFGKCKCLHTGSGNTGVNYEMGGTILSKTVKEKDLGVTLNANMKVSEQCRIAASKGNQVLGMIRRNITYKEKSLIIPLYKEHVTERVEKIVGRGNGGTILVHVGTNNTNKEGTTAIVEKYRKLLKKTKQARLGQIILSGILPMCGNRIQGYRNSKRMAVNGMVERLCKEEEVGYLDMWDSFVGNEELYFRDGLHLSGKGAAVLAEGLSGAVASGLGKVRYLN